MEAGYLKYLDAIARRLPPSRRPGSYAYQTLIECFEASEIYCCTDQDKIKPGHVKHMAVCLHLYGLVDVVKEPEVYTFTMANSQKYFIDVSRMEAVEGQYNMDPMDIVVPDLDGGVAGGDAEAAPDLDQCSICLDDLDSYYVLACGHKFHYHCILRARIKSDKCPICRALPDGSHQDEKGEENEEDIVVEDIRRFLASIAEHLRSAS